MKSVKLSPQLRLIELQYLSGDMMQVVVAPSGKQLLIFRVALHALSMIPLAWLAVGGIAGALGDSPFRAITRETGDWALYFLCITLAVTPLRRLTGWEWLASFRRLPGMYAFFYGVLHFGAYLWMRRSMDPLDLLIRIFTRPALLSGLIVLLILSVLAVTSTRGMFQRLGGHIWKRLHRLTYVGAMVAIVHYWLEVSRYGSTQPLWFGVLVALLLLFRLGWKWRDGRRASEMS
jgi:sulfoxide reductase heme-binding subunit YedZ